MAHSKGDPYISVAETRWSTDQGHDGEEAQGMMRIKVKVYSSQLGARKGQQIGTQIELWR